MAKKSRRADGPRRPKVVRRADAQHGPDHPILQEAKRALYADHPADLLLLPAIALEAPVSGEPIEGGEIVTPAQVVDVFASFDVAPSTAYLTALRTLTDDELLRRRIDGALSGRGHRLPAWLEEFADTKVSRVAIIPDLGDSAEVLLLQVDFVGGAVLTMAVMVDHACGGTVHDVLLNPLTIDEIAAADAMAEGGDAMSEVDPAWMRAYGEKVLAREAPCGGDPDVLEWPLTRPLLQWMLRTLPNGGVADDPAGWSRPSTSRDPSLVLAGLQAFLPDFEATVGGAEALASLTDDPLPDEQFDWTDIEGDIVPKVAEMLELCDACSDEHLDVELRTATRRLLRKVVLADQAYFRGRATARTSAAAVSWMAAHANQALEYGTGLTAGTLLAGFGVKSAAQRAKQFLRSLGLSEDFGYYGPMSLGDPALLSSSRRAEILGMSRARDMLLSEGGSRFDGLLDAPEDELPLPPPTVDTMRVRSDLRGTKPPVWRRLEVAGDITLDELHDVIQSAMGWDDGHLHRFYKGQGWDRVEFRNDSDGMFEMDVEGAYEHDVRLDQLLREPGDTVSYLYDFGDSWEHQIRLEKVIEGEPAEFARCTGGRLACPPEDCGGVWGYSELAAWVRAGRPDGTVNGLDATEMREWLGDEWNPDDFSATAADRMVAELL